MIAAARTRDFQVSNRISADAATRVDAPQRPQPASKLKPETKPDAPLTKVSRLLTAGIHASVLVGIVVFVVLQLSMAATAKKRATIAKVIAAGNTPVSAPCDGVFYAEKHLTKGTKVTQGQLLGHIKSIARDDEIKALRDEIGDLRKQRVMLRSVSAGDSETFAEVSQKLRLAQVKLEAMVSSSQRQKIYSPVDGIIELGLSGARAVEQNESIAEIWRKSDELLIEVEGPIDVLNQLLRKQTVAATFDTQQGSVEVSAQPIQGSLKPMTKKTDGKATEIWGAVQCRPASMPAALARPGALGHL